MRIHLHISQALQMHGVPKMTLHNHISGNVTNSDKPGPDKLLLPPEEEEFSNFLVQVAHAGYGKTRKEIRNIAGRVAVDKREERHQMYHMGSFKGLY